MGATEFVHDNWIVIVVMLASGGMLLWQTFARGAGARNEIGTVEATRLINRNDAFLLDLRETSEYEGERLPNALQLPLSQLEGRAKELTRYVKRPVIAYGGRANRARLATRALEKLGFGEIFVLKGGLRAWKDAGLPVERA